MTDHATIGRTIAKTFEERAEALRYKGKARDNACLDFWCGAAALAEASGQQELANYLGRVAIMVISVRGYIGNQEMHLRGKAEGES